MTTEAVMLHAWERKTIVALLSTLSLVFMVWAGVVWQSSQEIVEEVRSLRDEVSRDRLEQQQYRTLLERRITILEERQEYLFELYRREYVSRHSQQ